MCLSKEQTIFEHRKMWNWIADQTEKLNKIVKKKDYCAIDPDVRNLVNTCWLCDYTTWDCSRCPIKWDDNPVEERYAPSRCCDEDSPYSKWINALKKDDVKSAAKYARIIANLPENCHNEEC